MDPTTTRLRATFDEVAERYAAIRPGYPTAAVADLVAAAGLDPSRRVLEIGCGTGQLTVPLAETGAEVVAVELGPRMAAVARRILAAYPRVEVLVGAFEEVPLPAASFDLVAAATSFHWIDPAVRVERSAQLLRPGGVLAVIGTHHIAGGTADFFRQVQACYEHWDPATPPDMRLRTPDEIPTARPELDDYPHFSEVRVRRHAWTATYTTAQYRQLLRTYSGHLALPDRQQEGLLDAIGELIDEGFGGTITKAYLTQLHLARRG